MSYIIVGATAGLGRSLSEALAERGKSLLLVARDGRDLETQANHLRIKCGITVHTLEQDLNDPDAAASSILKATHEMDKQEIDEIEGVLFPIGLSSADDKGLLSPEQTRLLTDANLTGIMTIASQFIPRFIQQGSGTIVGFGSIAASRGRKSNIVYAAAKRGLESYFESLRHLLAPTPVRVHFYKMGYLDSAQTFGKRLPLPKADTMEAAQEVLNNLDRDRGAVFYPWFWGPVTMILRLVPWPIFKKMNF